MRILIAEDEPISRRMLVAVLRQMGHDVVATTDGREAWEVLQREDISLVIADWMMADMDGLELVRRIRAREADHYVYVIFLTSRTEKQDVVRGLDAGADDYVTKPFQRDELMVRIKGGLRVLGLERQLAERNQQMTLMAMMDGLTGIGNRRSFDEALERYHNQANRYGRMFSLAMIDIDFFKRYNDTFGHGAGDTVLRSIAQLLKHTARPSDLVFRYGGEEFVCLFPETDADGALAAAIRLHDAVATAGIPHPGNQPAGVVTVSVGLATFSPDPAHSAAALLRSADDALFSAKRGGRNRVATYAQRTECAAGLPHPPTSGSSAEAGHDDLA
ncbi:MAG: diguanylate cyclase [Acidobacteria bacterium]|nr:diguanylate cyclase [Acidobacteriota bacterium]